MKLKSSAVVVLLLLLLWWGWREARRVAPATPAAEVENGPNPPSTSLPAAAASPPGSSPTKPMSHEPLVVPANQQLPIAKDGTPLRIELAPGNAGSTVELQAWTDDQNPSPENRYSWRFKVTVPNGGLVERLDPLLYAAPADGYTREFDYAMDGTAAGDAWQSTMAKSFFIHLNDDTYALLQVQLVAAGAHFVTVFSSLNPAAGSRNLQPPPAPKKMRR